MANRIQLSTGFGRHPKIKKLRRMLGCEAVLSYIFLLMVVAENKPETGELPAVDTEDVALAADWQQDPDEFVETLVKLRLLDVRKDGGWRVHDWSDHQKEIMAAIRRKERARAAALARWSRERSQKASAPCNMNNNISSPPLQGGGEDYSCPEAKAAATEGEGGEPRTEPSTEPKPPAKNKRPPRPLPPGDVFIELPLIPKDGEYPVTEAQVKEWGESYPALGQEGVKQELRKMREWLLSNPQKRKTKRGIRRFVTGWLGRAQDKPRPGLFNSPGGGRKGKGSFSIKPVPRQDGPPRDPMLSGVFSTSQILAYWRHRMLGLEPADDRQRELFTNIGVAYAKWYELLGAKKSDNDAFHGWARRVTRATSDPGLRELARKYLEMVQKEGKPWERTVTK